jgi:hypothetical protein
MSGVGAYENSFLKLIRQVRPSGSMKAGWKL